MTTLDARSARRRYLILIALRWLPIGLLIPITVLLALSRGLSLTEIGLVFASRASSCWPSSCRPADSRTRSAAGPS